jgi:hypothetical protein
VECCIFEGKMVYYLKEDLQQNLFRHRKTLAQVLPENFFDFSPG